MGDALRFNTKPSPQLRSFEFFSLLTRLRRSSLSATGTTTQEERIVAISSPSAWEADGVTSRHNALLDRSLKLPGPPRVHGLDPQLAQLRLARNPLGRMSELFDRYGAPVALVRGGGGRVFSVDPNCPGVVFVRGSNLAKQIMLDHDRFHRSALTGQLTPSSDVPRTRPILEWGTGLFAVNGDEHRRHRRLLSPFFNRSHIETYAEAMQRATAAMLNRWKPGQLVDVHREMMDLTLRNSAKTLLGLDVNVDHDIVRAGAESLRLVLSPWVLLAPWDLPGFPYRRFLEAVRFFNQRMRSIIDERRRTPDASNDVLTKLISARDEAGALSDAEVVGHASIVYAASHDTTGNGLTWTLFLLTQHPSWYRAVSEEVRSTVVNDAPTLDELERLQILDGVIRESLRLLPPAPWTTRIAATDTHVGSHFIPKGTEVVLSIFHTHRIEPIYHHPNTFDPGRWQHIKPDVFQFTAFGAGARSCIGSGLALLHMKLILAMLIRRYRMEFHSHQRIDPVLNITMAPRHGLRMRVHCDGDFESGAGSVRGSITALFAG
ncbi:MAG TPA: cytochrome P450 [Myxococcota bacterium]|nr:cytochrome P450 [Myxococcota bacterium]